MKRLDQQVAIVTGAGRGIGQLWNVDRGLVCD